MNLYFFEWSSAEMAAEVRLARILLENPHPSHTTKLSI